VRLTNGTSRRRCASRTRSDWKTFGLPNGVGNTSSLECDRIFGNLRAMILKRMSLLAVFLFVAAVPARANADFTLAVSVGKAFQVSPAILGEPTTLMVAPGWGFAEKLLRVEAGFAVSMPDLAGGLGTSVDIQFRPALVVSPPLFPLHLRVFGVLDRIINGVRFLPGAALGLTFTAGPLGIFVEAGALPRITGAGLEWLIEPRAGLLWIF
jgi:hypothetical protein